MTWVESRKYSEFNGYNITELGVDKAWLTFTNLATQTLWLYQLSKDCKECPYARRKEVGPKNATTFQVDTNFPYNYRIQKDGTAEYVQEDDTRNQVCQVKTDMGEFGVYELTVSEQLSCQFVELLEPVNIYFPLLIAFFFYLGLGILLFGYQKLKPRIFKPANQSVKTVGSGQQAATPAAPARQRLRSLDTFRGICIVIMIFVNDGAAKYAVLEHATWDGLFVADLVFPWFLWIMGVCIPVSIKSQVKRNTPTLTILRTITERSLKLIGVGVILNTKGGPVLFKELRLPGVLQRFGICYFVIAATVLMCASKDFVNNRKADNKFVAAIQDIVFIWKGWIVVIVAVALHLILTFFLKVPGCPTGYLGPGGLHKGNAYPGHCIGGAAGYIDRKILTSKHMYQWPTTKWIYESDVYDPEGILGTLNSFLTVWLGVQAGLTLQVYPKHRSRLIRWAVWAVITGAIGAALCGAKQTGGPIPLNKNLWSLSFVLVLGSFALILLGALYVVIDMLKLWSGTPFFEPGMNSILLYIGHSIANDLLPWHFQFNRMDTHFKHVIESLWGTSMWVLYSIYLFHVKYFFAL